MIKIVFHLFILLTILPLLYPWGVKDLVFSQIALPNKDCNIDYRVGLPPNGGQEVNTHRRDPKNPSISRTFSSRLPKTQHFLSRACLHSRSLRGELPQPQEEAHAVFIWKGEAAQLGLGCSWKALDCLEKNNGTEPQRILRTINQNQKLHQNQAVLNLNPLLRSLASNSGPIVSGSPSRPAKETTLWSSGETDLWKPGRCLRAPSTSVACLTAAFRATRMRNTATHLPMTINPEWGQEVSSPRYWSRWLSAPRLTRAQKMTSPPYRPENSISSPLCALRGTRGQIRGKETTRRTSWPFFPGSEAKVIAG